jgi:hypothetical protein
MVEGVATLEQVIARAARSGTRSGLAAEDDTPETEDTPEAFRDRLAALADDVAAVTEHAQSRADLRTRAGRAPFSAAAEGQLRSIRDTLTSLSSLLDPVDSDPSPADEMAVDSPAPKAPDVVPPAPVAGPAPSPRFRSPEDWRQWINTEFNV